MTSERIVLKIIASRTAKELTSMTNKSESTQDCVPESDAPKNITMGNSHDSMKGEIRTRLGWTRKAKDWHIISKNMTYLG